MIELFGINFSEWEQELNLLPVWSRSARDTKNFAIEFWIVKRNDKTLFSYYNLSVISTEDIKSINSLLENLPRPIQVPDAQQLVDDYLLRLSHLQLFR